VASGAFAPRDGGGILQSPLPPPALRATSPT
jgi:hypothetical protein